MMMKILCSFLINSITSSIPAGLMQEANDRKERRSKFSRRRMVINKSSLKLFNTVSNFFMFMIGGASLYTPPIINNSQRQMLLYY